MILILLLIVYSLSIHHLVGGWNNYSITNAMPKSKLLQNLIRICQNLCHLVSFVFCLLLKERPSVATSTEGLIVI